MPSGEPKLIEINQIWEYASHNAFTDLFYFQNQFWCTFREAESHADSQGTIRLLASTDGAGWQSIVELTLDGVDLRDPKLCQTPDGRMMMLVGGSTPHNGGWSHQSYVTFSKDGRSWGRLIPCLPAGEWLWRVTWHGGRGYGAAYSYTDPADRTLPWILNLFLTDDGIHYRLLTPLQISGHPNETTLRFNLKGEMLALVRREEVDNDEAYFGVSAAPYNTWSWHNTGIHLGGPNFVLDTHSRLWVGARVFSEEEENTALLALCDEGCKPLILLESGGDTGYPGMLIFDDILWMSYYSSHEGKANIYLAKIELPKKL